jgi:sugar-specific transcriptional regulator TrmB
MCSRENTICIKDCQHLLTANAKRRYTLAMDLKTALVDLGLAKNEAVIYLELLKQGTTQVGPLVKTSKLHRMLVYTALERLKEAGLVTTAKKKNVQFFQAVNPTRLIEQTKRIQSLAESIVPDLQRLQSQVNEAVAVKTFFGREGLITNLTELVESAARQPQREICIMGGAGGEGNDPITYTEDWYTEYVKMCKKQQIKKRLLVNPAHRETFAERYEVHQNNKLRTLPVGFSLPMFTRITRDIVSIEIYQPQITVIQIRNEIVAQNYLDSFETLWKLGK